MACSDMFCMCGMCVWLACLVCCAFGVSYDIVGLLCMFGTCGMFGSSSIFGMVVVLLYVL